MAVDVAAAVALAENDRQQMKYANIETANLMWGGSGNNNNQSREADIQWDSVREL
jgi:hypothetical protein